MDPPRKYYSEYRKEYEKTFDADSVSEMLKASYIKELEETLAANVIIFRRKNSFYYNALLYALVAAFPFLICLGFHITKKETTIHKVEIVNSQNSK